MKCINIADTFDEYMNYRDIVLLQGKLKIVNNNALFKMRDSIVQKGFVIPIFVWDDDKGVTYCVDGHTRIKALRSFEEDGYDVGKVPVIRIPAEDIDDAKEKLLLISSQYGEVTADGFIEFVASFNTMNRDFLKNTVQLSKGVFKPCWEEKDREVSDDISDVPRRVKKGEIWELGNSVLACVDSLRDDNVETVVSLFSQNRQAPHRYDFMFTSPSYETMDNCELSRILMRIYVQYTAYIAIHFPLFIEDLVVNTDWNLYIRSAKHEKLKLLAWNVWNKVEYKAQDSNEMFPNKHDFILVFGEFLKDTKEIVPPLKSSKNKKYKKLGSVLTHVADFTEVSKSCPSAIPVEIPLQYIKSMTQKNDYILDPMAGAGSTLIAAEISQRTALCFEINEKLCDIVVQRYILMCQKNNIHPRVQCNFKKYIV